MLEPSDPLGPEKRTRKGLYRTLLTIVGVWIAIIIFAYGFEVTQVDLEETRSERRQTQLIRIIRALARPEIIDYEQEEFLVTAPILVGCPDGDLNVPEPDTSGPYMVVSPACAGPEEMVTVEGFNLQPNTQGPINFIPPSGVTLQRGNIQTDEQGHFITEVELPNRSPLPEFQEIQTITRRDVGLPFFTVTAKDTWGKIIETVFMAFLATVLGVALGVPLSFFAARNLMVDVKSSVARVSLSIIAWPVGIVIGAAIARYIGEVSTMLSDNPVLSIGGLVVLPAFMWGTTRWAIPPEDEVQPSSAVRLGRFAVLAVSALALILTLYLLSGVMLVAGNWLADRLGTFAFLGDFIADIGDIVGMLIVLVTAIVSGGFLSSVVGRGWVQVSAAISETVVQISTYILAALAGAILFMVIALVLNWLYQTDTSLTNVFIPIPMGSM
ncbi:MAG: hypothetical protein R3335_14300, partial [Anaerolineales bacterium]|nr:hypothetical protein [Anaerolineales bacterium]